jgi:magnesium-protoporphyrin O-methyltransferase
MHAIGRLFPRGDRAPAIVPISEGDLAKRLSAHPGLEDWRVGRTQRIARGFYVSQAVEVTRR